MAGRLEDQVAVITGAASGIGKATARRFVEEGARVVIADIQADAADAAAAELGDTATAIATDVTDEEQVAAAVDLAVETWGRLDCMFNNAGIIGAVGPITETIVVAGEALDPMTLGVAVGRSTERDASTALSASCNMIVHHRDLGAFPVPAGRQVRSTVA